MVQHQLDNPNTPALDNTGSRLSVFNPTDSHIQYRNALAAMDASRNNGATGLHDVPIDSAPQDKFANKTNEQILPSLTKDQADFAKQALKDLPDGKIMEGLRPGEIAVGNWQPSQEEKTIMKQLTDQMVAKGETSGQCKLPDGSFAEVHLVPYGTAPGSFLPGGRKPNSPDDSDEQEAGSTSATGKKSKNQKQILVLASDTSAGAAQA